MSEGEGILWSSTVLVVRNFLNNHISQNYAKPVNYMIINFRYLGYMSIKVK